MKPILNLIEDYICITAIALMAIFPLLEIAAHFIFKTGIPASSGLIVHFLLIAGLVGGMICTRSESHLAISLTQFIKEGPFRDRLKIFCNLVSAFVSIIIALSSVSFIMRSLDSGMIGFIPKRVLAFVIPIAFCVMSVRFARRTNVTGWNILIPVSVILLGVIASFPVIAKIIWGFDKPEVVTEICFVMADITHYLRVPMVIFFILAALGGTPLFIVLGGLTLFLLQATDPWLVVDGAALETVSSKIYNGLINQNIIAIPLFAIVGFFLSESKAGERLVTTFRSFFSWLLSSLKAKRGRGWSLHSEVFLAGFPAAL